MIIVIMIWMLVLKLQNLKIYKAERKIELAPLSFKYFYFYNDFTNGVSG